MSLDVLEAGRVSVAHSRGDGAARRRADVEKFKFVLMLKVLQRDDPLRRLYLQKRWHGLSTAISNPREVRPYEPERTSSPLIALSCR